MNYSLIKMQVKPGKEKAVENFLLKLKSNYMIEMSEHAKESGLLIDSYFFDAQNLYVFKKTNEKAGHLHMTPRELSENKLLQSILAWTDECIVETEQAREVVTFDLG